jgi:hypothetical protein
LRDVGRRRSSAVRSGAAKHTIRSRAVVPLRTEGGYTTAWRRVVPSWNRLILCVKELRAKITYDSHQTCDTSRFKGLLYTSIVVHYINASR